MDKIIIHSSGVVPSQDGQQDTTLRVLVIAGSVRPASKSSALARAVVAVADGDTEVELFPPLNMLPHFDPEDDGSGSEALTELRAKAEAAHGVVVVTPEYAHGAPGVLKNALDWLVGSGELANKPVAVISSSPSGNGGCFAQMSLVATLTVMGGMLVDTVAVPYVGTKLDSAGELTDRATIARIKGVLDVLWETSGKRTR